MNVCLSVIKTSNRKITTRSINLRLPITLEYLFRYYVLVIAQAAPEGRWQAASPSGNEL